MESCDLFCGNITFVGNYFWREYCNSAECFCDNDMAAEVVELINEIRAENGLPELTVYVELQQVADLRASEIKEVFSHNRPDGTTCDTAYSLFGISTPACAENIAVGYSTAQSVVEGWMNSENHRANILNSKYTHIAVGLVYDASSEYKYYWVQEFSADYTITAPTTTVAPTTTAAPTTTVPPITIALLVVVIGVLVIYIILMKRKKDEDNGGEN